MPRDRNYEKRTNHGRVLKEQSPQTAIEASAAARRVDGVLSRRFVHGGFLFFRVVLERFYPFFQAADLGVALHDFLHKVTAEARKVTIGGAARLG